VSSSSRRRLRLKKKGVYRPPTWADGKRERVIPELEPEQYFQILFRLVEQTQQYTHPDNRGFILTKYLQRASDDAVSFRERVGDVITALGLYLISPERIRYRVWKPELLEAYHAARKSMGWRRDRRFVQTTRRTE